MEEFKALILLAIAVALWYGARKSKKKEIDKEKTMENRNNHSKDSREFITSFLGVVILLVLLFGVAFGPQFFHMITLNETQIRTNFHKGYVYKCRANNSPTFLVSKERGWRVDSDGFIKDDIYFEYLQCDEK